MYAYFWILVVAFFIWLARRASQPSIYEHIKSNLSPDGKITPAGVKLPDEDAVKAKAGIGFVPGAHDVSIGDPEDPENEVMAQKAFELIISFCDRPSSKKREAVIAFVREHQTILYIEQLLQLLGNRRGSAWRLWRLAHALATESSDREVVKMGIALLSLLGEDYERKIVMTLGKHEEFTFFAAATIACASPAAETEIWKLARHVSGWGRIHCVERLSKTKDPEIKRWLLREGYRNDISNANIAHTCAVAGDLKAALQGCVDEALLTAAGEIIEGLLEGSRDGYMEDYADGAVVMERYLALWADGAGAVSDLLRAAAIRDWLGDTEGEWPERAEKGLSVPLVSYSAQFPARGNWPKLLERGWTQELRAHLQRVVLEVIDRPIWRPMVVEQLQSKEYAVVFDADRAADVLGLDTWPYHWARLQESPDTGAWWMFVDRATTRQAMESVVALAEEVFDLSAIATGPADELGLGDAYLQHRCLDWVLQELKKHPGIGLRLIEAGIKSPVVGNRNLALEAIGKWDRSEWPEGMRAMLKQGAAIEPNERVRSSFKDALGWEELEFPSAEYTAGLRFTVIETEMHHLWDFGWLDLTRFKVEGTVDDPRDGFDVLCAFLRDPISQRTFGPWGEPSLLHGPFLSDKLDPGWFRQLTDGEFSERVHANLNDPEFYEPPSTEQQVPVMAWIETVKTRGDAVFALEAPDDEDLRVEWHFVWTIYHEYASVSPDLKELVVAVIGFD